MKYFAYGMNTNLDQMAARCPGAVSLGLAWIDDYEFVFRTHADIEKSPGGRCYGVMWEIDDNNLRALDMLEGYPYYYTRFEIVAHTIDTSYYKVNALVYQMTNQEYIQEPGSSYLEMVREGYAQHKVPQTQLDDAINIIYSTIEYV